MSRRLKRFAVTPVVLVDLAKNTEGVLIRVVENALPADAKYAWATFDPEQSQVWVFVESASFDEVHDNAAIPRLPCPQFEKLGRNRQAEDHVSCRILAEGRKP